MAKKKTEDESTGKKAVAIVQAQTTTIRDATADEKPDPLTVAQFEETK